MGGKIKKKYCLHIMVTLNRWFKGDTREKWHMLPLVDITESGIEVRKWVGRWLEVLVEQHGRFEGWVFQGKGRERTRIQEYEGFQEVLRYLQAGGDGLILAVVDIGEDMSLRISLSRGSTTEVMNRGLETS